MTALHDMHCHLAFMDNGEHVAAEAANAGSKLFANTITPDEWQSSRTRFEFYDNVALGLGMHPWWVGGGQETDPDERMRVAKSQQDACLALLNEHNPRFIGEVGLDFGRNHKDTEGLQRLLFESIATWASEKGGKLLSIHTVKSAQEVFGILRKAGAFDSCTCIFHWFTGSSDMLKRAVQAGCYFSCGPRMLSTGKGREYVKAIPVGRLLLETDAPPRQGANYSYGELRSELEAAAEAVAAIKGRDALDIVAQTSEELLG